MGHALRDFRVQAVGIFAAILHEPGAHFGSKSLKPEGRQANIGHFGRLALCTKHGLRASELESAAHRLRFHAATETIYILGFIQLPSSLSAPSFSKEG